MPAALSVNVNKVALLRNARGRDVPNLLHAVDVFIGAGCQGITVHPRLDQRHIRFDDVPVVARHLREHHPDIEYNVECQADPVLIDLVAEVRPDQCTLVPVIPGEITSDHGWDLPREHDVLAPIIARLTAAGVRTSMFMDPDPDAMAGAAAVGVDRVELYTGPYAWAWGTPGQAEQTRRIWDSAHAAVEHGLGVNAGHDLDADNLAGLRGLDALDEVSIGHWVIVRALDVGMVQATRELLDALGR